jgi:hypothetical protein
MIAPSDHANFIRAFKMRFDPDPENALRQDRGKLVPPLDDHQSIPIVVLESESEHLGF